jgi:hypothetical protein
VIFCSNAIDGDKKSGKCDIQLLVKEAARMGVVVVVVLVRNTRIGRQLPM